MFRIRNRTMSLSTLAMRLYVPLARFSRGMTLGVRGAVFDRNGRIFLVKHTYLAGWYLPGGGVEPGEDTPTAVRRELREEGGITPLEEPQLFGLYLNRAVSSRDHVALFVCREWDRDPALMSGAEIRDAGFFAPEALPEGATAATQRRIAELAGRAPPAAEW